MEKDFNEVADRYDGVFQPHVSGHYLGKRVALIRRFFERGAHLLDVGCGTGVLMERLFREGFVMEGADVSEKMAALAAAKGAGRVVCASADALPYPDGRFDGVVCIATLHHLGTAFPGAMREMARVTRPGGRLLLWDHNPLNPYWRFLMRRVPQDTGRERLVTLTALSRELGENCCVVAGAWRKGFVPDFAPRWAMGWWRLLERGLEGIPVTGFLLAHNVVMGEKDVGK